MKVKLSVVAAVSDTGASLDIVEVSSKPVFYTGNKKSAVAFVKSIDSAGEVVEEAMIQVSDDGKITIAKKRTS